MTTELEQEFFKVFGIEPKNKCGKNLIYPNCLNPDKCGYDNCIYYQIEYPDITAEELLEIICIILNAEGLLTINTEGNIVDIKDFVLRFLIGKVNKNNPYCHYKTKNKIKHQIQQLFKEEE